MNGLTAKTKRRGFQLKIELEEIEGKWYSGRRIIPTDIGLKI